MTVESEVRPFAEQFMESIPEEDVLDLSGEYDEESQIWILDNDNTSSSAVMSGIAPERPPTTCPRMTKVGPNQWTSDRYTDD